MKQPDKQRLEKIAEYCNQIGRTADRYGKDKVSFEKDIDYQQSVSFSILQIGELVSGLSEEYRSLTKNDMPWHKIKALRNVVVHGYGDIDYDLLWDTVITDIPKLEQFCDDQLQVL